MKYIIAVLCTLTVIIIACNSKSDSGPLSGSPESMNADEYTITIDKDTTLVTKNGALIKIPKGTFSTDKGNTVVLDIKEAYTIQQMIAYGLHTEADGDPLSSGGMIYINAAAGQNVTINKPIKVALPTPTLQRGMQLYKGVKDEKGNINWKDPSPIADNPLRTVLDQGQQLFQSKCGSCHTLGKDGTGPDLAHFVNRFMTSEWGYKEWVMEHGLQPYPYSDEARTPESTIADTATRDVAGRFAHFDRAYVYKCNLVSRYKATGPPLRALRTVSDTSGGYDEFDRILRYIQLESNRLNLPLPSHAYLNDCIDSCARYRETTNRIRQEKADLESKRKTQVDDNGAMVRENRNPVISNDTIPPPPPPVNFEETVSPDNYGAVYYQFTIESFGWFNVDILLKEFDGSKESELFVRITGEFTEKVEVYLIIPSTKVYTQGGATDKSPGEFAFAYKSGKLFLPQNATAYIMAVTESNETIAFALKEFTTGTSHRFDISLQRATKEEFNTAISILNNGDTRISTADSKNAADIRQTDAKLKAADEKLENAEKLKPKNCDCECIPISDSLVGRDTTSVRKALVSK